MSCSRWHHRGVGKYFTQEDEAMYAAAAELYKKRADEKKKKGKKTRGKR